MIRVGRKYSPEEVLPFVIFERKEHGQRAEQVGQKRDYDGDMINMASLRLQTFKRMGLRCCVCGIKGKFFVKERHEDSKGFHFNLYALDSDGNEVLMTKDHIVPRSKGGADKLGNMQTMCKPCNEGKGAE